MTDQNTPECRDLLPVIVERENATLPEGCDAWGIKSVRPDLRTYGGYKWPYPGGVAECDTVNIVTTNKGACPERKGDGLCVATTWEKMASGSIPARTLLLVAYASADVLGYDCPSLGAAPDKLRVSKVHVVAVVDGERLIREDGQRANLQRADLRGAALRDANLQGADLWYANLRGANLRGATLEGADFQDADLRGADLRFVDLRGAYLRGTHLRRADLQGADLRGANLWCADLRDADLRGANLRDAKIWRADLRGADLRRAELWSADLQGTDINQAHADERTQPPAGYVVRDNRIVKEG